MIIFAKADLFVRSIYQQAESSDIHRQMSHDSIQSIIEMCFLHHKTTPHGSNECIERRAKHHIDQIRAGFRKTAYRQDCNENCRHQFW